MAWISPSRLRKNGDRRPTPPLTLAKQPVAERRASPCARVDSRLRLSCRVGGEAGALFFRSLLAGAGYASGLSLASVSALFLRRVGEGRIADELGSHRASESGDGRDDFAPDRLQQAYVVRLHEREDVVLDAGLG